jgi:hypothetical protein
MAYRVKSRGVGSILPAEDPTGIASSDWANCRGWSSYLNPGCYFTGPKKVVGVPGAPTGTDLILPPASGEDAAALQQAMADEAMRQQQQIAAAQVQTNVLDQAASVVVDTGDVLSTGPGGLSWWLWGGLALAGFAVVTLGGGSPRRYGR